MLLIDEENSLEHVAGEFMFYFLNYCGDQYRIVIRSVPFHRSASTVHLHTALS